MSSTNNNINVYKWAEALPEKCPPEKAITPDNIKFYRLCNGKKPASDDFCSLFKEGIKLKFKKIDKCIEKAVTIWKDIEDCKKITRLPRHKNKSIFEINLTQGDGLIMKTFDNSHYSWWRSIDFDYNKARIVK